MFTRTVGIRVNHMPINLYLVMSFSFMEVFFSTRIEWRECASLVVAVDCWLCFRFCFCFFSGLPLLEFHLDGVALVISSSSLDFSPSITILQLIKLFIQKMANKNFCRNFSGRNFEHISSSLFYFHAQTSLPKPILYFHKCFVLFYFVN